ncbi:uncharacterized protein LOC107041516 isoform X2 [Diachasma alloeum]|uniref:uncharacterized protein LOC107041516 isoform X2 n=1 Tax=Diachasma alloeum TaxID=454923 RepID=UPI00073823FF|nr:uncharacterized protein LOC107041516 isoform X2 [Diachasma alloeum]
MMSCIETRALDPQDWMMIELRSGAGMTASTLDRPASSRIHYTILIILDAIFSAFVAAPAVVGYWRGTWGLSDLYMFPNDPVLSNVTSIVVGYGGLLFFNVVQGHFNDIFHPDKHRLFYYVGSRIYTAVFGFCCVNAWRGGWQALDLYTEQATGTVLAITIVALAALIFMKAVRNISAPPFSLSLDSHPGYFEVPTMFRVDNSRDCTLYILDCAFSVGVVGTLVVFVWRGIWVLLDLHLFPENREYSAIGSMVIGYILVAITFCFQPVMRYVCSRLQGLSRLLAADAFLVLSFLGTVNVWRGIWGLLEVWLFPDNVELSCWITHIGCFLFLGLLNCSNSILVRGVYIDAEEEEGKCVVFPCHYLRLFFKIEREKKEARRRNHVAPSRDYPPSESAGKDAENGALLNCTPLPTIIPPTPECLVLK